MRGDKVFLLQLREQSPMVLHFSGYIEAALTVGQKGTLLRE